MKDRVGRFKFLKSEIYDPDRLEKLKKVHEGCVVFRVVADWSGHELVLEAVAYHPQFEEVEEGGTIPFYERGADGVWRQIHDR